MELKFLGTAAAEGFPALFCECDTCKRALAAKGRNIRTRSQAIIDDKLLIDFPADTYFHMIGNGIDFGKIEHCIITHTHSDHFYPADFEMRRMGFSVPVKNTTLNIYGTQTVYNQTKATIDKFGLGEDNRVVCHKIIPFHSFQIMDYIITPLPADHDPQSDPVIYLINSGEKTLLYAHDTGIFPTSVFDWIREHRIFIDYVSLDCTAGLLQGWEHGHLGIDTCVKVVNMLKEAGAANEETGVCLNHFSHNCLSTYNDLLPISQKHGFDVSYDGKAVII